MLKAEECPGVISKGWHLWVAWSFKGEYAVEACYFCGTRKGIYA